MTCIAAFRQAGKGCLMAADRRVTYSGDGSWTGKIRGGKIHRVEIGTQESPDEVLFATRGTVTFGSIMETIEWPKREGMESKEYLMKKIWPMVHKAMEALKIDPQKAYRSDCLICIKDEIFTIGQTGAIINHAEDFVACGDGASAAYGAYDMWQKIIQWGAADRPEDTLLLSEVIKIVAKRNWSCDDEIDVEKNYKNAQPCFTEPSCPKP